MAALLVAMSVMAIGLSVALPAWSHMIRREKEEELIFRGTQYARAINQYQRKYANASPQNLDVLIKERFLRKKFKDPLSPEKDGEFQMLYLENQSTASGRTGAGPGGRVGGGSAGPGGRAGGGSIGPSAGPSRSGLIVGVTSKNTGQSLRVFNGKTHYNEWQFIGMEMSSQAGPGAGQRGGGPQRGGPQRGDSQRGGPQRGGPPSGGSPFDSQRDPQRGGRGTPNPPFAPTSPFAPNAPMAPR
jgi:type II secretory pathway pseudopilin PulG